MQGTHTEQTPILNSTYQSSSYEQKSVDIFVPDKSYILKLTQNIIQHLNRKQWSYANKGLSHLMEQEYQNTEEFFKLAENLAVLWTKNPNQMFLAQFFDFFVFNYMDKVNKEAYTKLIFHVLQSSLESLTQFYQNSTMKQENKKNLQENHQIEKWQLTLQILRSYVHRSLSLSQNMEQIWFICWIVTAVMLHGCSFNKEYKEKCSQKQKDIIQTLISLKKSHLPTTFCQRTFHQSCLLLRQFIRQIKRFMSQDNKLLVRSQMYPSVNNCSLLMKIIESQFMNESAASISSEQKQQYKMTNKLDCLVLLITIMQTELPRSQNYNRVLQYAIYIVYFLQELDSQYRSAQKIEKDIIGKDNSEKSKKWNKIVMSPILFYCGQLVSMILFRNSDWFVKFCRNEAKSSKSSSHRTISKLLQVYKNTVKSVMPNIEKLEHEQIIYKRLVLGFCGLLKINSMETVIEQTILDLSKPVIKIIEQHHGWHDEEGHQLSSDEELNSNNVPQGKKRKQFMMEDRIFLALTRLDWNEEYYNKNQDKEFEEIFEVQQLLKAMYSIKDKNAQIFQIVMQNFDEKQSILWMVELEKYGEEREDYSQECSDN